MPAAKTPQRPAATGAARRGTLPTASALVLILALGGCAKLNDVTGSIGAPSSEPPRSEASLRAWTNDWGKRYDRNSDDKHTVLTYARALRATSRFEEAAAVLQRAVMKKPNDLEILAAYGKSLADLGRFREAASVLERAQTPERPSWSVLSAQGSVADQMGDHAAAQRFYELALKIVPNEPSVLSNLGLSYALSKHLPDAERTLRLAAAQPRADERVRQNLALVLALQGKFPEAEEIERQVLPPAEAAANIASIRRMIAESNIWREIQTLDQKGAGKPVRPQRNARNG